jgi:hypothetical protein
VFLLIKKHAAAAPLILAALVFAGCEYFNAPIKPFIDMSTAKVTLGAVDIGVQKGSVHFVEQTSFPIASQPVSVTLNNPQQFNIKVAVKSAAVNGLPPPPQLCFHNRLDKKLSARGA